MKVLLLAYYVQTMKFVTKVYWTLRFKKVATIEITAGLRYSGNQDSYSENPFVSIGFSRTNFRTL